MAPFCGNCGFQPGGAAFCPQCGSKQSAAVSTPPSPAPSRPAASPPMAAQAQMPVQTTAPKSGSGLKILMIVLGVIGLLGMLLVGGIYYAIHKVKQTVVQRAHDYGVELP